MQLISDILLSELRAKFPAATFAIEVVNAETKQTRLLVNGTAIDGTWADIEDPVKMGTDGKPEYRRATQLILGLVNKAVNAKLQPTP